MTRNHVLFGFAIFLGTFLLFLVEPMAAKQLLPALGGSAAVWITCLVFFQTALLAGYLYAHWLARRSLLSLHCGVLFLAAMASVVWAVRSAGVASASQHPVFAIFAALGLSIGLPFLMLGATSPLLQAWLARVEPGGVPYRLFALSNLASLLALAFYPTLIEPYFTLRMQRMGWCGGFLAFAAISAILAFKTAFRTRSTGDAEPVSVDDSAITSASVRDKLLWVLLPMGAAMQLSAVTSYLTQNIAAIPLLWILPLAVYLITLILAFQFPRLLPRGIIVRFLVVMLAGLGYALSQSEVSWPLRASLPLFLLELFAACLFCHTEAHELRPRRTSESTLFYLLFAAGGALGSFLIGIASPLVFRFNYDLALSFLVTALLALAVTWQAGWAQRLLWATASGLMLALAVMLHIAFQRNTPIAVRNFYGSLHVRESFSSHPGALTRTLTNGTIQHGSQIFSDELRKTPTTYYAEDSGVGLAMRFCCQGRARNVGVVGLGVGTIAAYGRAGDRIEFYEINPAVAPIAQNAFTYLRDSEAKISIIPGDARTSLQQQPAQNFDVLVVDAFSGDAIPLHMLTAEAMQLYKRHLAPGGIVAFHISNGHVDLEPATVLLARAAGMEVRRVSNFPNDARGEYPATWMLLTQNANFFAEPEVAQAAREPAAGANGRLWTDDYSSLLPFLHW